MLTQNIEVKKKDIGWVTGLKGACAVSVVLLHMLASFYADAVMGSTTISRLKTFNFISLTPINIIFNGSFAVYIFWMLAAFLISNSWFSQHDIKDMQRKIFNKYFRNILPICICSIIAFAVIKLGGYFYEEAGTIIGNSFFTNERDFNSLSINSLLADLIWNDFFTGRVSIIPPLWTLHIDFKGSLLAVLLLIWISDKKRRKVIYGIMLFIILTLDSLMVYACFLIGIMLAEYKNNIELKNKKSNDFLGIICLLAGAFLGGYPPSCIPSEGIYYYIYIGFVDKWNTILCSNMGANALYIFAATLILFGIMNSPKCQGLYKNKLFCYLGKKSLSIYLIHIPVLFSLNAFLFVKFYEVWGRYNVSVGLSCMISFAAILMLSELFEILFFNKLKPFSKKIVDKLMEDKTRE